MKCYNLNYKFSELPENELNKLALSLQKKSFNYEYFLLMKALSKKTENIAKSVFKKFSSIPLEYQDLDFIKYASLKKALEKFSLKMDYNFSQIYCTILRFRIFDYIKSFLSLKNQTLNYAYSFSNENEIMTKEHSIFSPEIKYNNFALVKILFLCNNLTMNDKKIFWLKYLGFSNKEIALKMLLSQKQIENKLQLVKRKLQRSLINWV